MTYSIVSTKYAYSEVNIFVENLTIYFYRLKI